MPAELPSVTKLGYRRTLRTKTRQVIGRINRRGLLRTVYREVDFAGRKAGELDIEIKFYQILEMTPQQIKIPDRLLGQPIVSDDHRPLVGIAQPPDGDGRDLRHAQASCCFPPAMACQDGAGLIDQDRIGPEAPDAFHQTSNLAFRMTPRVARKFLQLVEWTPGDAIH